MYRGKRLTTNAIRKRMQKICKELGIKYRPPHKIRKTYGTILIDNNVDTRFITDQMRHTDILCTEKYYHRNRKTDNRKAEILGGISEFQKKAVR